MATIICTRGLPASGKSTWALAWVAADPQNRVRIGRDPIRDLLYGERRLTNDQESFITKIQTKAVETALGSGKDVVIDDMHLKLSYLNKWRNLAARKGYGFEVKDFNTPVDECIMRDADRGHGHVGAEVISKLARRFPNRDSVGPVESVERVPVEKDYTLPPAYIVDIDGTLALHNGRSPYDYSKLAGDIVNEDVFELIELLSETSAEIIVMSGRPDTYRRETEDWLFGFGLDPDMLLMRPEGDERDDALVKYELFNGYVRGFYNVIGVFDDRNRVVDMWRKIGLTCFQVADGDF